MSEDMKKRVLVAANESPHFEVEGEDVIGRRRPSWRTFVWDYTYGAFVSTTWDGHFCYRWMLVVLSDQLLELPAAFAPVHGYDNPNEAVTCNDGRKMRSAEESITVDTLALSSHTKYGKDAGGL